MAMLSLLSLSSPKRDERTVLRLFAHLRNGERAEHLEDALVKPAERLANRAVRGLAAFTVIGDAGSNQQRPVNRADDVERGDAARVARQLIASGGAVTGGQQTLFCQLLEHLGHQGRGDLVKLGYLLGAAGAVTSMR